MKLLLIIISVAALFFALNIQQNKENFFTSYNGAQMVGTAETPPPAVLPSFPRTLHENQSSICINNLTREHYQGLLISRDETIDVLQKAGFVGEQVEIMSAISHAESGSDLRCIGDEMLQDRVWGVSFGLWQIRTLKNPNGSCRNIGVLRDNIEAQAICAKQIYDSQGYKAWSVYTNGKYRRWLNPSW